MSFASDGFSRNPSALPAAVPTRGRSEAYSKHMNRGCQAGRYLAFDRYSDSSCQLRLATRRACRQSLEIGPAPIWAPRSNASRNIAKLSDTGPTPNTAARSASDDDHQLDLAVVGGRVTTHQVEGEPVAAPRHEAQEARSLPSPSRTRTRTQSPSSGSSSRPSAIENPRSSPPSPRHCAAASLRSR